MKFTCDRAVLAQGVATASRAVLGRSSLPVLEGLLREERYAALYRALRKLPDQPRELLTLHYFSGLSLRRAGELTGMTEGAAKTALCRARQRLRTILEEGGYEI